MTASMRLYIEVISIKSGDLSHDTHMISIHSKENKIFSRCFPTFYHFIV